jgi:hypothetical protein
VDKELGRFRPGDEITHGRLALEANGAGGGS